MGSIYNVIAIICFALAALFLILGIVLFFVLKINNVIGYFTGKNERKSIEQMRMEKNNKVVSFNYADKVQSDGIRNINDTSENITSKLTSETTVLTGTTVLSEPQGTTVLENRIIWYKNIMVIHTKEAIN